jgi:PAS domain S-box-containing protein
MSNMLKPIRELSLQEWFPGGQMSDVFIILDREWRYVDINSSGMALGLRDALIGQKVWDLFPEAVGAEIQQRLEQVMLEQVSARFESYSPQYGAWFDHRVYPSGEGVVIFMANITEQKQAEQALQTSEREFRAMFELAGSGKFQVDPATGRFIKVNRKYCEITGYTEAELLRLTVSEITHPEDRQRNINLVRPVLSGEQEHWQIEKRYLRKDGQTVWVLVTGSLIRDEQGRPLHTIATIQDITDRKRAEDALRESEARYRELFENAKDIIYTLDLDGNLTSLNKAGEDIFGFRREELLYKPISRLVAPAYLERMVDMRARKLAGEAMTNYELEAVTRDQRYLTLEVSSRLIYKDDKPVGIQGIARDITERKRVEQALRQSEAQLRVLNQTLEQRVAERTAELERSLQELDQFTYVASHDLKAPLRAINYLAEWIVEDATPHLPEASQAHLAKLQSRIKRMEKLLDDLLTYSRVGRRYYQTTERIDIRALIEELSDWLAPPPGFTITVQGEMPFLTAYRVLLELVFRNLIENAIKHHHRDQGQVQISARDLGDFIEFSVTDDGPGIDETYHTRIFQIFQTLQPRDKIEGTGIGLAIVKKAVESQTGTISVISAKGEGTTFRFTWPKV